VDISWKGKFPVFVSYFLERENFQIQNIKVMWDQDKKISLFSWKGKFPGIFLESENFQIQNLKMKEPKSENFQGNLRLQKSKWK